MIGQGFGSWARGGWDGATLGVYRRQIEAAEAAGDSERLTDWTTRREQVRQQRHQRMMDAPKLVTGLGLISAGGLVALAVGVLLVGLLAQASGSGSFLGVLAWVRDTIGWMFGAVSVLSTVALWVAPAAVLLAAWREGRRRGGGAPG